MMFGSGVGFSAEPIDFFTRGLHTRTAVVLLPRISWASMFSLGLGFVLVSLLE